MIRDWLIRWLKLEVKDRPVKVCKACMILQEQLEYERNINKEMLMTLTDLVNPKKEIIINQDVNPQKVSVAGTWGRKRAVLEARDRQEAKTIKESKIIAHPVKTETEVSPILRAAERNSIEELEKELEVGAEESNAVSQ